jgi:uridine kinase
MDGYHHPRVHRHRQGRASADGYYEDAYDLVAFRREVLEPLTRRPYVYRRAIIDLATDTPAPPVQIPIPPDGVLVVDGTFLQRSELSEHWDAVVWVDTPFDIAELRGVSRDAERLGGTHAALELFRQRYGPASRRYIEDTCPAESARHVFRNADIEHPVLVR